MRRICFLLFIVLVIHVLLLISRSEAWSISTGSRHHIDTNDPQVQSLARWAAHKLGGELITVETAEDQVVAGVMFYIDLKIMSRSKQEQVKVCRVQVWVQEWRDFRKLMPGSKCSLETVFNQLTKTMEFSLDQ